MNRLMNGSIACLSSIALFLSSFLAFAEVRTISEETKRFTPTRVSSLEEFALVIMKKQVFVPGLDPRFVSHQTDIRAVYRTTHVSQIEDYVIVQYIRGCQFETSWDGKKLKKSLSIHRRYFGDNRPFHHPSWQVDSDNSDPVYSSYEGFGRFALLRWNHDVTSLDPETAFYYAEQKPSVRTVFLTDLPGSGMILDDQRGVVVAKNSSLEFQTCLFNAKDIPPTSTPDGKGIRKSRALACLTWDHKFLFNSRTGKIEAGGSGIDSICK